MKKLEQGGVTTSDLAIKPGSGFGFGTDKLKRKEDPLLQQRKKELPKKTIKQLTGEQAMATVVTFKSNSRDAIGLQFNILDMHNKTTSDMWTMSAIKSEGNSHSFTVKSAMPDQYLTQDNLERNMVAGVTMSMTQQESVNESEVIAESMVNAMVNGLDADSVTEAYLGADKVEFITEAEDEKNDGESPAVDGIQKDILAMMRMTDDLKMSDADAKAAKSHLDKALEIMKGKKNQG